MSISHTFVHEHNDGASNIRGTETVTSGSQINISEAIPSSQTNLAVACAFANAKLKSFAAHATVAMTVYTNQASTGTPQEQINLIAGQWYTWTLTGSYLGAVAAAAASPFAGDVTGLYVTNTTAGTLTIRAVVDPT